MRCLQQTSAAHTMHPAVGNHLCVMCGHGTCERDYAGVGPRPRGHQDVPNWFDMECAGKRRLVGLGPAPHMGLAWSTVYAPY